MTRALSGTSPRFAAAMIVAFLAGLSTLSLVTLDHLKYDLHARGSRSPATIVLAAMTLSDWFICGLTATIVAVMLSIPAIRRGFVKIWEKDGFLVLLPTIAALVWCGHSILGSGLLVTGDAATHVGRVNHLALALRDGDSLFWDNYFFGGSTLLQFTGPVFHWMAAAVTLAVGDATQAIKYVAFTARLVAAVFMYRLMRRFGLRRATACLVALFYGSAFFMTYMEIVRSSFPQMINFAAMPAVVFFLEGILEQPILFGPATIGLSLSTILFIGCHQPTALIFGLFIAVYLMVRLGEIGFNTATVGALAVASTLTIVGSLFFLVPFAVERGMTADDFSTGSLILFAWPSLVTLRNFITWGAASHGPFYSAFIGFPMLACVCLGAYASISSQRLSQSPLLRQWRLFMILAVASLFARGAYVREATFTFFFLCTAAGFGLEMLVRNLARPERVLAATFILTMLDAGPLAVQPWNRLDYVPIETAGKVLATEARGIRILEVESLNGKPYVADDPTLSPVAYSRVQILSGPHKQDATKAHNGFAGLLKIAQQDLQQSGALSPESQRMLAAVNVGWVIGTLPDQQPDKMKDPVLGANLRIPEATPFLVSGRLNLLARPAAFDTDPLWDFHFDSGGETASATMAAVRDINDRMHLHLATRQADTILVPDRPVEMSWDGYRNGRAPTVALLSYLVKPGLVHLSVEADGDGFIRLAHPVGLGTRVLWNASEVTALPDVFGLIVLPVTAGRNDYTVFALPSTLRLACFWTTIAMLTALSGAAAFQALRFTIRRKSALA